MNKSWEELEKTVSDVIQKAHIQTMMQQQCQKATQKILDVAVKNGLVATNENGEQFEVASAIATVKVGNDNNVNIDVEFILKSAEWIEINFVLDANKEGL